MQFTTRILIYLSNIIITLGLALSATAQENKEYILRNTNVEELQRLGAELAEREQRDLEFALEQAREKGWPTMNLVSVDELGRPVYQEPTNNAAATMTQTVGLRNTFGVQGQGMVIDMFEALDGNNYAARQTHQDLTGRVTIFGNNSNPSSHATHVAGTLIGSPPTNVSQSSKGMAPQASLSSYSSGTFLSSTAYSGGAGVLISNNSWGYPGGWSRDQGGGSCFGQNPWKKWTWLGSNSQFNSSGDDPGFGQYSNEASFVDVLCRLAPMHLPVFAAGNYDNQDPQNQIECDDEVRNGMTGSYVEYNEDIHPRGNSSQTSTISRIGNAKNILTVGNLKADYTINASSSRGRTDDGRIKPDICGKGTDLFSAESASNNAYGLKTGTSMASPNVAGSLLLLQELYENMNGNSGIYMRSATLKGLAIHHAQDLGLTGPDYTYGWGLLRAQLMGNAIVRDVGFGGTQEERILEIPGTLGHVYTFNTTGNFRVTLSYTDREGTATSVHNDPTRKLVNDLDLRVIGPGGTVYFPYVMSTSFPYLATTGDNDLDNVEQVYRINRPAGTYQVHVNAEGNITGGSQPYSLIITGQNNSCNYSISHGPITLTSTTYNAQNDIRSIGDVAAGGTVTYNAGSSVSLKPGFSAPSGSSFIARIQSCN